MLSLLYVRIFGVQRLPVVIIAAVDARLASETRESRVKRSPALAASEAFAVPGLVHGNEEVAVDDLETTTATQSRR